LYPSSRAVDIIDKKYNALNKGIRSFSIPSLPSEQPKINVKTLNTDVSSIFNSEQVKKNEFGRKTLDFK